MLKEILPLNYLKIRIIFSKQIFYQFQLKNAEYAYWGNKHTAYPLH